MLEQDYLMRLLMQFFKAIVRTRELKERSPQEAAEALEDAIGAAVDMDGAALLALSPDSIASVMHVTDVDPNVVQFVARSLLLESVYLHEACQHDLAGLREAQARAIAEGYGFGLPDDPSDFDSIVADLEQAALAGGFDASGPGPLESLLDDYTQLDTAYLQSNCRS